MEIVTRTKAELLAEKAEIEKQLGLLEELQERQATLEATLAEVNFLLGEKK